MEGLSIVLRSCLDALRPRFLGLTLLALVASCVVLGIAVIMVLNPLAQWILDALTALDQGQPGGLLHTLVGWLLALKVLLLPMLLFGLLWPVVAALAVLFAGFFAMPRVLGFLAQGEFSDVQWRGQAHWLQSVWVGLKASIVYIILWVLSMPLWLVPGLFIIIPVLLTAHLLIKVMSFDVLSEVATPEEIRVLSQQNKAMLWSLGLICTVFSLVPPVLLLMPVVCALVFARFYLQGLRQLRQPRLAAASLPPSAWS